MKEPLHERIDQLSDDEAQDLLDRLEWEETAEEELTPKEWAEVKAGFEEIDAGKTADGETLLRKLGLWRTH